MSDRLPRSEAELHDLADFYTDHDVSDEVDAGEVVTSEPMPHDADDGPVSSDGDG